MEHNGVVTAVGEKMVEVEFVAEDACAECKAKGLCGVADNQGEDGGRRRFVTVYEPMAEYYSVGERVVIGVSESMGMKAATWAYIFPFFVLLGTLLFTLHFGLSETFAGLVSLGAMGVYYVVLWSLRRRIEKDIVFKIRKI